MQARIFPWFMCFMRTQFNIPVLHIPKAYGYPGEEIMDYSYSLPVLGIYHLNECLFFYDRHRLTKLLTMRSWR